MSGTAILADNAGHIYYTTKGQQNCSAITITAYDPIHGRISGHFTSAPPLFGIDTTGAITNGAIDSGKWMEE